MSKQGSERAVAAGTGVVSALLACALLVGVALGGIFLIRPGDEPTPPAATEATEATEAAPSPLPSPSASATRPPRMRVEPGTTLKAAPPAPACDQAAGGITPASIAIPEVTSGASVVTPPRDGNNIPGTPPISTAGKYVFAWDTAQGTRPGDDAGNVLINAHTWPDGSALGNAMLAHLFVGDQVVVQGDGVRLCYEVNERVEVLASEGLARYYDLEGPNQLAILACSGRRLGPGNWEKRTVWFATLA